jgi:hypothetical protein
MNESMRVRRRQPARIGDGTGIVNVTNDAARDFAPDWSAQ